MFYDEFVTLCAAKGVSRTRACVDCGISRTAWHKWADGATPNGATINKFAEYFGVSASYLLGRETENAFTSENERKIGEDELKAAFWGGEKDLSQKDIDEMWEDVRQYAHFKAAQRRHKKNERNSGPL